MKIAITGDFHFGFSDDALEQASQALNKAEALADVVVVAGDLFDHRVPKQETVDDALRLFGRIAKDFEKKNGGVRILEIDAEEGREKELVGAPPIIAIFGTHERRTKGLVNAVQLLDSAGLVVNCHAKKIVVEKAGERVVFQGLGGIPEEYVKKALKLMEYKPVKGAFNVFVFHQTMREIIPIGDEFLAMQDLPDGFELYVDGHIHWHQELEDGGKKLVIPGSTVVTQMKKNETGAKGIVVFDTGTKKSEFVEINSRPFVYEEIVFREAGIAEVGKKVGEKLAEIAEKFAGREPLVKIKLAGTLAKGLQNSAIDLKEVEKEFGGKMLLSIDKALESAALKEKIEKIRAGRQEERKSVQEMGMEILREKLADGAARYEAEEAEELFAALADGDAEKALAKL